MFSFDDGNKSDIAAAQILQSAGLAGKFFVLTGRLDHPNYLDHADLEALRAMDMEVGLHGHGHVDWRTISSTELDHELSVSRDTLASSLGDPITSAAIPFGAYNGRVYDLLRRQDFRHVYTSDPGPASTADWFVRRWQVESSHSVQDVIDFIEDRSSVGQRIRRTIAPIIKRWR